MDLVASSQDDKIAPAAPPFSRREISSGNEMSEANKALAALGYAAVSIDLPRKRFQIFSR
jgi:hypothetical protein